MQTTHHSRANGRLRQERIARSWRQKDLAEQLGTTVDTVKRWERGRQQPSTYFRVKLCILFGKSAEELGLAEGDPSFLKEENRVKTDHAISSPAEPLAFWTVPYLRNPHFTGRDTLLEQLALQLAPGKQRDAATTQRAVLSQPQAIKGLGGIGKTQIAVEYAYRSRERGYHTHILWIQAASEDAIISSFLRLADILPNGADPNEQNQRVVLAAIKRWLEQCPDSWLLIFDNADDLSLVEPYIPLQGQGSILLTTRAAAVSWLAHPIEVEQMGLLEGTRFLLQRTQRLSASDEESNAATNVVIALDGFPLALDQAGAYIEETGCSFDDYLHLYEQHRATLLARRGKQATHYPYSVATTWSLSFQKVEQADPAAARLLHLCAYLSPDHIPEELLTDGAAHWPLDLQQAVADPARFNALLEILMGFSLIKRFAQEHLLSLHRLVQAVQVDQIDAREQCVWAERVVRAVNTLFPSDPKDDVETWPKCLRYLEQVQVCNLLIRHYHLQFLEAAELLDRAGVYLREHASFGIAEELFQQSLTIAEQQFGPEHPQVASCLNNLGILYKDQGKVAEAESCSQRALHIWEQILGPEHLRVALPLNNLGLLYYEQGYYEQAEPFLRRALHVWEQALGPQDPQVAGVLNNLGILYAQQGLFQQAEPLLQRALDINEQALGSHHPHLVNLLNNLGGLHYDQGHYEQAEPFMRRALLLGEKTLGPNHPGIASPLSNLGELYYEQGQYEQAEPLLLRSLHINEQSLGPDHPYVASSLNALANLYREQGRHEQAKQSYQRALALRQQHLSPQHPDVAKTLHDLAHFHSLQQETTEALSLYQQALIICEQVYGPQHQITEKTRQAITRLLQEER